MDIKKVEIKAEDYPHTLFTTIDNNRECNFIFSKCKINMDLFKNISPLSPGDVFFIKNEKPVKVGDFYDNNKHAVISEIIYDSKHWWQFWKKKKQLGYKVRWQ